MTTVDPFDLFSTGSLYLSGVEKDELVTSGKTFTITSIQLVEDARFGEKFDFVIDLDGKTRILSLGYTPLRDAFVSAVKEYLPVNVRLKKSESVAGRTFYAFERA